MSLSLPTICSNHWTVHLLLPPISTTNLKLLTHGSLFGLAVDLDPDVVVEELAVAKESQRHFALARVELRRPPSNRRLQEGLLEFRCRHREGLFLDFVSRATNDPRQKNNNNKNKKTGSAALIRP